MEWFVKEDDKDIVSYHGISTKTENWFVKGIFHEKIVRRAGGMRFIASLIAVQEDTVMYNIRIEDSKYNSKYGGRYDSVRVVLNELQYGEMLKSLPQFWFNHIEPLLSEYPIVEEGDQS